MPMATHIHCGSTSCFNQLLPSTCQINQAKKIVPIEGDPHLPFYFEASKFTNLHAVGKLGLGCSCGHHFETTLAAERAQWDAVLVMDGAHGRSKGRHL